MADSSSKGNKKHSSTKQKEHYASHKWRILSNKIARLQRHIKRNAYDVARKARRGHPILIDQQAINNLKTLTK